VQTSALQLAKRTADLFAALPHVEAVALAGSQAGGSGSSDSESDIDLYVYARVEISLEDRLNVLEKTGGASRSSLDLNYWGQSDEWLNASTGLEIDIVYFDARWIEEQISSVVEKHQAKLGYTTCFWRTIRHSLVFSDPNAWLTGLQQKCQIEYPEVLRKNIIALNHPVLRDIIPAYFNQLNKAVKRYDLISINHRLAAFFASYFDIIFAVNRELHPGEKRLLEFAASNCDLLPNGMETDVASILLMTAENVSSLPNRISRLLDRLDQLLEKEGLLS
jgi:hypothetical protein